MKAAKRIRAYLDRIQQDAPQTRDITGYLDGPSITRKDLEAVLDSRESWRQGAKALTEEHEQMLRDLHLALWPDKPVHLHSFEHMLTTIRNRTATPYAVLSQERSERERLASQLREAEKESEERLKDAEYTERQYNTLRQELREVCEAVLPLYADKDAWQQLAALQAQLERAENVVRAQKNVIAEIQDAADQVTGAHLFYRTWTSVPEQIKALGDALSEARGQTEPAIAAKVNQALTGVQSKLRDTMAERDAAQQQLREQGDAAARAVQKRKQAEDDLHELRIKISQICAQRTGGYPGGSAFDQLNRINTWLASPASTAEQELRELRTGLTDLLGVGSNE